MGVLSSNFDYTTMDLFPGSVTLRPSGTDTSTGVIRASGSGSTRVKAFQKSGYVRLNKTNRLKIGNANLNISTNCMIAVLFRIPTFSQLNSLNGRVRLFRTTQQTAGSLPKFSLDLTGGAFAALASERFLLVNQVELNNGNIGKALTLSQRTPTVFNAWNTNISPYGLNGQPRPCSDWFWGISYRSTVTENNSTPINGVNSTGNSLAIEGSNTIGNHRCGFGYHPQNPAYYDSAQFGLGSSSALLMGGATATNTLASYDNVDFVLGDTDVAGSVDFDVARIIKVSGNLNSHTMMQLLKGFTFADFGITPDASDFDINFSSLSGAGSVVTVETGSPTFTTNSTDGPMLYKDITTVASGGVSPTITINNGTVTF